MSTFKLDVPTLAQEQTNSCWHTSAMMIWMYWQQKTGSSGPMNTMAPAYNDNNGLPANAFITLANTVGLKAVPLRRTWYGGKIKAALKDRGPLWCAGYWAPGPHVIVLTGVDGNTIYYNDPDGGVKKTSTIHWFNTNLNNGVAGCVMQKDPNAY